MENISGNRARDVTDTSSGMENCSAIARKYPIYSAARDALYLSDIRLCV